MLVTVSFLKYNEQVVHKGRQVLRCVSISPINLILSFPVPAPRCHCAAEENLK